MQRKYVATLNPSKSQKIWIVRKPVPLQWPCRATYDQLVITHQQQERKDQDVPEREPIWHMVLDKVEGIPEIHLSLMKEKQ